jgi:hypothetical protein
LDGPDQVRGLRRGLAGEQQGQGGDGNAEDGDRSPGGHAGGERAAVTAVLGGPPVAQRCGQRGLPGGPAVDGRGRQAKGGDSSSPASRGPLSWFALVSAAPMPMNPNS